MCSSVPVLSATVGMAFAEAWHERAIQYGTTYRFEVTDQSTTDERRISELDVRRRASARAARIGQGDFNKQNEAVNLDLSKHSETLKELAQARETKIALSKRTSILYRVIWRKSNAISRNATRCRKADE